MSAVARVQCPECGTPCIEQESVCWQCGARLRPVPEAEPSGGDEGRRPSPYIRFGDDTAEPEPPPLPPEPEPAREAPARRTAVLMTGEVVEIDEPPPAPPCTPPQPVAATIGGATIAAPTGPPVLRLTFCKNCGYQNEEEAQECARCKRPLEVVARAPGELQPLARVWGFDVLGLAWIVLGLAAIYCGQFLIKADPEHPGITWADYFWTGIVACAPGILIIMRHYFCKIMFWVMMLGSLMVWPVIGFIWLFVGLGVSPNAEVGLAWLAVLSVLSIVSFLTVRLNDAFDYGL